MNSVIAVLLVTPPKQQSRYCDQFVCLSVCPPAYLWTVELIFTKLIAQIPCGRDTVLLWWHCDKLCTSSFMDDVTFGRSGPYGGRCDTGAEFDVYECLVNFREFPKCF